MDARAKLIAGLREKQGNQSLNQFANAIGINQAQLWRLFNDKGNEIQFGTNALSAILVAFPDLTPAINEYLAECGRQRIEQRAGSAA